MVWLLVLLPLTLFAQIEFGPVRLDDGTALGFYLPVISELPDGNLLCVWVSGTGQNVFSTYGQVISPTGELIGDRIWYETSDCVPDVTIIRVPDGREGQLFHHG